MVGRNVRHHHQPDSSTSSLRGLTASLTRRPSAALESSLSRMFAGVRSARHGSRRRTEERAGARTTPRQETTPRGVPLHPRTSVDDAQAVQVLEPRGSLGQHLQALGLRSTREGARRARLQHSEVWRVQLELKGTRQRPCSRSGAARTSPARTQRVAKAGSASSTPLWSTAWSEHVHNSCAHGQAIRPSSARRSLAHARRMLPFSPHLHQKDLEGMRAWR